MSYSLNAFCPCEGYRVSISGDGGRIEYIERHFSHIITGDREVKRDADGEENTQLILHPLFEPARVIPIVKAPGDHGGGDPLIQEQIFSASPPPDNHRRGAGHEQGAASLLVGAAANRSLATGQPVRVADIATLRPDARRLSELV
jgi:hypothetical protein